MHLYMFNSDLGLCPPDASSPAPHSPAAVTATYVSRKCLGFQEDKLSI